MTQKGNCRNDPEGDCRNDGLWSLSVIPAVFKPESRFHHYTMSSFFTRCEDEPDLMISREAVESWWWI
ncbi:MAG: hypothetical protein C4576_02870 [Desulfobacteraceae bacterium]|nr:MAG: hypothetical protein C4576_02870 [Desulfobacteraceae bacterium]